LGLRLAHASEPRSPAHHIPNVNIKPAFYF
jgi:hypothetical protein